MAGSANVEANQLIVFGGGFRVDEIGAPVLNNSSVHRLDRTAEYYYDHPQEFTAEEAVIVCAGWQTPSAIDKLTPAWMREADVSADYLVRAGIPHSLIEKEGQSTDTFSNVFYTFRDGYIKPEQIGEDNPLGLVSHPNHLRRIKLYTEKLGVAPEHVQTIATKQTDQRFREFVSRTVWRGMMLGTTYPEQVEARRESLGQAFGHLIPLVREGMNKLSI